MYSSTSWSDQFADRLKRLPGPYWFSCLILGLFISLINLGLFKIAGFGTDPDAGVTQATAISLFGSIGFGTAYAIYILGVLPAQISCHLQKFGAILKISGEEYTALHNRMILRNMPGRLLWIGQRLVLLISMITLISLWFAMAGALIQIILFLIVLVLSLLLLIFLSVPVLIKIINVSKEIVRIQYLPMEVNILNPFPLFALSRLTRVLAIYILPMATALGFLAISLGLSTWKVYAPLGDLPTLVEMTILVLLTLLGPALLLASIFIFVFPVLWIRRLIIAKKEEMLEKLAGRLQTTFAECARRTANGEWTNVSDLTTSVEFLTKQEERYRKIPEWPWEGRIFNEFIGALVIPVLLWVIQFYLEKHIVP